MKFKTLAIIFCLLTAFSASSAFGETLTLTAAPATVSEAGGTFEVTIQVNDPTNTLGAAFTVEYDTNALSVTDVSSTFFDTFATPVDGYSQALVDNDVSTVGTRIAAARAQNETDTSKKTLFTLTFAFQSGATAGDYDITIKPTNLNNTTAGYSATGEDIDLLVGYDGTDYPVLLSAATYGSGVLAEDTVTFSGVPGGMKGDFNNDGTLDVNDAVDIYLVFLEIKSADDSPNNLDYNGDGDIDVNDAVDVYLCFLEINCQ